MTSILLMVLWVWLVIGFVVGLLLMGCEIYQNWSKGKDLTLGDCWDIIKICTIITLLGPVGPLFLIYDIVVDKCKKTINKKTVILSGSKTAKVVAALTTNDTK